MNDDVRLTLSSAAHRLELLGFLVGAGVWIPLSREFDTYIERGL